MGNRICLEDFKPINSTGMRETESVIDCFIQYDQPQQPVCCDPKPVKPPHDQSLKLLRNSSKIEQFIEKHSDTLIAPAQLLPPVPVINETKIAIDYHQRDEDSH